MIEDHFQEFNAVYDERFARQWGYWRPVVARVVEKYVACRILKHGFAPSSAIAPLVAAVFRHFGTTMKRRIEGLKLRIDVWKLRIDVLKLQIPVLKLRIEDSKRRIGDLKLQIDDLGRRPVDVNRYTPTTYTRLTGIGPVLAAREPHPGHVGTG